MELIVGTPSWSHLEQCIDGETVARVALCTLVAEIQCVFAVVERVLLCDSIFERCCLRCDRPGGLEAGVSQTAHDQEDGHTFHQDLY